MALDDLVVYQNGGTGTSPERDIDRHSPHRQVEDLALAALLRGPATETPTRTGSSARHSSESPARISSETYLCIGPFDSKSQAESVAVLSLLPADSLP